jgi:transposase-like protein
MKSPRDPRYARHRFPAEVISHAVWLYFRFPLSLRMVEEMLAARGIEVSHETVRQWAMKFGESFAKQIRRRLPAPGDKWHLALLWQTLGTGRDLPTSSAEGLSAGGCHEHLSGVGA